MAALGISGALFLTFRLLDGRAEFLMLLWVGLFPLGYYFLTFPKKGSSVFTFDRFVVAVVTIAILFCPKDRLTKLPRDVRRTGWAWAAFVTAAALSIVKVPQIIGPLRLWTEAFVFPAFIAWYVVTCFPVREYLRPLHCVTCLAAIYSAAIGTAEMVLGRDLLPFPGAAEIHAGTEVGVLRVNGPFTTNNSFALIGLVAFCLLVFLKQACGKLPHWQRALHLLGVTAALVQAMLPLFRSVFVTIAIIFVLDLWWVIGWRQKFVRVAALAAMGLSVLVTMARAPELFEERVSDPSNVYARLAQQQQNLQLFMDNPVFGVGFSNFHEVASRTPGHDASYQGTLALDYPHSNIGAVLAETGLAGFIPFILSQFLLVVAFWKLRTRGRSGKQAWIFFLYIFLSYWISGMALTSGYYSDLNLWYLFSLAVLYKYAISKNPTLDADLPGPEIKPPIALKIGTDVP